MKRSAKRRKKARSPGLLGPTLAAVGEAILRNPGLVGGVTAFAVTFTFVSANAVWYQPHAHEGAFFQTRERNADFPPAAEAAGETVILIEREAERDPQVERVQAALRRLDLYSGEVDGIAGPLTDAAVKEYQRIAGVEVSGEIDARLIARLESGLDALPAVNLPDAGPLPVSLSAPESTASVRPPPEPVRDASRKEIGAGAESRVVRIQAGLRAFGHDGIEIDGVAGAETRAAIREFQSLFGLPVTGEPDEQLYAKMREIGLTN